MSNYSDYKVVSINNETGVVSIDSSELTEGSTNLFLSDARIEANAVVSGSKDVTDKLTVTASTDLDDIETKATTLTDGSQIDYHEHVKVMDYNGSLSNEQTIVLDDNKAAAVAANQTTALGALASDSSDVYYGCQGASAYDPVRDIVLTVYSTEYVGYDGLRARVSKVNSDNTVTVQSEVKISTDYGDTSGAGTNGTLHYDSQLDRFVWLYFSRGLGLYVPTVIVIKLSGTGPNYTITGFTPTVISSQGNISTQGGSTYDPDTGKHFFLVRTNTSFRTALVAGSIDQTNPSDEVIQIDGTSSFITSSDGNPRDVEYDPVTQLVWLAGHDYSGDIIYLMTGWWNGSGVSLGPQTTWAAGTTDYMHRLLSYNVRHNRMVYMYHDPDAKQAWAEVLTINPTTKVITRNTATQIFSVGSSSWDIYSDYADAGGKTILYCDASSNNYIFVLDVDSQNNTISIAETSSSLGTSGLLSYNSMCYVPTTKSTITAGTGTGGTAYTFKIRSFKHSYTDLFIEDFAGICQETNSSSGKIALNGHIATVSGVVIDTYYYLADDGSITTSGTNTRIGKGIDTDKLLLKKEDLSHINDETIHFTEGNITINSTQVSGISEDIQDVVGTMFDNSNKENITITYTDGSDSLEFSVDEATTSGLGVASFDSNAFTVVSGIVTVNNTGTVANWEYGTTANRPATPVSGTRYFDSDLNKPIWAITTASGSWVDAMGNPV